MIHIENITINIQAPSTESGPTSARAMHCSTPWLKASLQSKPKKSRVAKGKCNHLPILLQPAKSWFALCDVLDDVSPGWYIGAGSLTDRAVSAIRALAKAR